MYDLHGTDCHFVHGKLFGAIKHFVPGGGLVGGALDVITGITGGGGASAPNRTNEKRRKLVASFSASDLLRAADHLAHGHTQRTPRHAFLTNRIAEAVQFRGQFATADCMPPNVRQPDGTCRVPVFDADPTHISPAERSVMGGQAVAGAFGIPAMVPEAQPRTRLSCPPGMVLGRDNLCYPKQVLRRDSRFRKWRPGVRPILTGGERNAIRRAKAAITKGRDAISGLGITVKKK